MQKAVILGGGAGGVVAASILKERAKNNLDVTLVEKNDEYVYGPALPMLMVGQRTDGGVVSNYNGLAKKGVRIVHAEATGISLGEHRVQTVQGGLDYDYLLIALGADMKPDTVPGFLQYAYNAYSYFDVLRIRERLTRMQEGHVVIFVSSLPIKGALAPYEMGFLLDEFFSSRCRRRKYKITIVTPEAVPQAMAGPLAGKDIRDALWERDINLYTGAKVLRLDAGGLVLDHGHRVAGDLFIGIPSHWGPSMLRDTPLVDENGWVRVNPETLETRFRNVYAIGDVTGLRLPVMRIYAPKGASFAYNQARVVAGNIISRTKGKRQRLLYDGRGISAMDIGYMRARNSMIDYYKKPAPKVALKGPSTAAYIKKISMEDKWFEGWMGT